MSEWFTGFAYGYLTAVIGVAIGLYILYRLKKAAGTPSASHNTGMAARTRKLNLAPTGLVTVASGTV